MISDKLSLRINFFAKKFKSNKMKISIIAILLGFIVGSIAYSLNVDNEKIMNLPSYQVRWITMSLGAFVCSFLISSFSNAKTSKVAHLVFAGIILSIIVRIAYDINFTDVSHNLLGIEIIIYSVITLPTAIIGAHLGKTNSTWKKK